MHKPVGIQRLKHHHQTFDIYKTLHPTTAKYSLQTHRERAPWQTTCCAITHLNKFKTLKSYRACSLATSGIRLQIDNRKKYFGKHVASTQGTYKEPTGQGRNHQENITWTEQKWKHNLSKFVRCSQSHT